MGAHLDAASSKQLDALKDRYENQGIVLAVGAGLSFASGLPDWAELLRRLAERRYPGRGAAIFQQLQDDGYTLPAIASILEASSRSSKSFIDWLRDGLYASFEKYYHTGVTDENRSEFIEAVKRNRTLAAVARLCIRSSSEDEEFVRNPLIHAVINFNFDAVFREYVRARYGSGLMRTIERPSKSMMPDRIPVYQMHGYLHFEKARFNVREDEAPDVRVFTEQEYFDFFNRPTSIYNYTFLHLLREYSCLFIGLSLKDDNIRRLLHYSKTERQESDLRERRSKKEAEERSRRHFALCKRGTDGMIDRLAEKSLRRLGVRVIWFDEFDHIPEILGSLRCPEKGDEPPGD
jgi:hypothetical protein